MANWIAEFHAELKEKDTKLLIISLGYITLITTATLLSSKLTHIGPISFTVGVFPFTLGFTMTDTIGEVWGRKTANRVVTAGLFSMVLIYIFTLVAIVLPPASYWDFQEAYSKIFAISLRVLLAGFIAYIVAQYSDIWLFQYIKKLTKDKHLWLRNNLSTVIAQLMDTLIIAFVGFWGILPKEQFLLIIVGWWGVKMLLSICNIPIIYLLVYWVKYHSD